MMRIWWKTKTRENGSVVAVAGDGESGGW